MKNQPAVFVVDDDSSVRQTLGSLAQLLDLPVKSFASANEFLEVFDGSQPGCLVLDIKMPDKTGLEVQRELLDRGTAPPIIMISAHADVRIAVETMSRGAIVLLEKPFQLGELTAHIRTALKIDERRRREQAQRDELTALLARLTFKEREVLDLVATGRTNREIASMLKLSIRAVEDRRARLMRKLGARSAVELMRFRPEPPLQRHI